MSERMPISCLLAIAMSIASSACGGEPVASEELEAAHEIDEVLGAEDPEARGFFFVIDGGGPVVALDRDPDPELLAGSTEIVTPGEPDALFTITRRRVDATSVSPELGQLVGRHVLLWAEDGLRCDAELGALELVRRTDRAELDSDDPSEARPLAQRAWEAVSSRVVLASRVRALDGSCDGARFATLSDDPTPRVFPKRTPNRDLEQQALAAISALDAYTEVQAEYDRLERDGDAPRAARWQEHDGATPSLAFWSDDERSFVGVDLTIAGGCGDFGATLWAIYELGRSGLVLRAHSRSESFPSQIIDVRRDGSIELFDGQRLLIPTTGEVVGHDVSVPFYGCSC